MLHSLSIWADRWRALGSAAQALESVAEVRLNEARTQVDGELDRGLCTGGGELVHLTCLDDEGVPRAGRA